MEYQAQQQLTGNEAIFFNRRYGNFGNLSNFAEIPVTYQRITYRTAEGAFQAQKTLDINLRKTFADMDGRQAKAAGRRVPLRPDWEEVKFGIMADIQHARMLTATKFKELVYSTGNRLIVEDTTGWRDNCWGCDFNTKPLGRNWLGLALMYVRAIMTDNPIVVGPIPFENFGIVQFDIVQNLDNLINKNSGIELMGRYYNEIYRQHAYIR